MQKIIFLLLFPFLWTKVFLQDVGINNDGSSAHNGTKLNVSSTETSGKYFMKSKIVNNILCYN